MTRGLVLAPEQWRWSSFRHSAHGDCGRVLVDEPRNAELQVGGHWTGGPGSASCFCELTWVHKSPRDETSSCCVFSRKRSRRNRVGVVAERSGKPDERQRRENIFYPRLASKTGTRTWATRPSETGLGGPPVRANNRNNRKAAMGIAAFVHSA